MVAFFRYIIYNIIIYNCIWGSVGFPSKTVLIVFSQIT